MHDSPCRTILVVEDERAVGKVVKLFLESAGFEVHIASSGTAALRAVMAQQPALVILDVGLPDIHGYDVARLIRKTHPQVPLIMLTGMSRPIEQLRGFAYGADAYLTKPFQPLELLETVSLLLGQTTLS